MKRELQHQALGMLLGLGVGLCWWSWSAGHHRRVAALAARQGSTANPYQLLAVAAQLERTDPYASIRLRRETVELYPGDLMLRRRVEAELRRLGTDLEGQFPGQ